MDNLAQSTASIADKPLTPKERADFFLALSKVSIDRFDKLAETSWKLRLSVWTALGAAAVFVLSADKLRLGLLECVIGATLTVGVVVVVVFFWSPFTYKRSTRFVRVARHWEKEVENLIGAKLPDYLLPKNFLGTGGWAPGDKLEPWYSQPVYVSQALVTVMFGALVIMALLVKAGEPGDATDRQGMQAIRDPQHNRVVPSSSP